MRVSFTGTRKGMTTKQWEVFGLELLQYEVSEWHDGDCIGADDQAHRTVMAYCKTIAMFHPRTIGHPCNLEKYRAYNDFDVELTPLPPLTRNRVMVDTTDITLATPYEYKEIVRGSGTWSTIRYCRLKGQRHVIIYPDGTLTRHIGPEEFHFSGSGSWSDLDVD